MNHLIFQQQFLILPAHKLYYLRCFILDRLTKLANTKFPYVWALEGGLNPACPCLNSQLLPKNFQSTVNREYKALGWEGPVQPFI